MDQAQRMGSRSTVLPSGLIHLALMCLFSFIASATSSRTLAEKPGWSIILARGLAELERAFPGQLGLHIKDLASGVDFSYRADEKWYIASGVKIPIAIAVLRGLDRGEYRLDTRLELGDEDFIDGAGETNSKAVGSTVTIHFLLEQMLIHSDNTASDRLIRHIGLEKVNGFVGAIAPSGFSIITTLQDVRRLAYSRFHPDAVRLSNRQLMALKRFKATHRLRELAGILRRKMGDLRYRNLSAGFDEYYSLGLNSATLRSYSLILEKVLKGDLLSQSSLRFLTETMRRAATGRARIRAGLPSMIEFAHKTGTQRGRICDFGFAWGERVAAEQPVLISACWKHGRNVASLSQAEDAFRRLGQLIYRSGVFLAGERRMVAR